MLSRNLRRPEHSRPRATPGPAGFTMIEILTVIVIIGILASFFIPVLTGISQKAREAAVKIEIVSLASSIADFKVQFGSEPPSHMMLYEQGGQWAGNPAARSVISSMWPRFVFARNRDLDGDGNVGEADPDGDGTAGINLSGAECLVFFLGGIAAFDANGNAYMTGFSRNPADPFLRPLVIDETRDGPFFEFQTNRLADVDNYPSPVGDRFPEYLDSLTNQTAPYLYLSSYNGRGYAMTPPIDCWVYNPLSTGNPKNPNSGYGQNATVFWNAKGFQIISPGFGPHENTLGVYKPYGTGGIYNPLTVDLLSEQDADNITNFSSGGRLKP